MEGIQTIKVTLVKSPIGEVKRIKETLRSLGLRRLNQVVEVKNNSAMRGMIRKVIHLVKVEV